MRRKTGAAGQIRELDALDAYIEFASTTHPSFLVGRDNGA